MPRLLTGVVMTSYSFARHSWDAGCIRNDRVGLRRAALVIEASVHRLRSHCIGPQIMSSIQNVHLTYIGGIVSVYTTQAITHDGMTKAGEILGAIWLCSGS